MVSILKARDRRLEHRPSRPPTARLLRHPDLAQRSLAGFRFGLAGRSFGLRHRGFLMAAGAGPGGESVSDRDLSTH